MRRRKGRRPKGAAERSEVWFCVAWTGMSPKPAPSGARGGRWPEDIREGGLRLRVSPHNRGGPDRRDRRRAGRNEPPREKLITRVRVTPNGLTRLARLIVEERPPSCPSRSTSSRSCRSGGTATSSTEPPAPSRASGHPQGLLPLEAKAVSVSFPCIRAARRFGAAPAIRASGPCRGTSLCTWRPRAGRRRPCIRGPRSSCNAAAWP